MCLNNNITILDDHLKRKIFNVQTIKKFTMNIYGEIIDSKCYRDNPVVLFPLQVEHQHNLTLGIFKCFLIHQSIFTFFLFTISSKSVSSFKFSMCLTTVHPIFHISFSDSQIIQLCQSFYTFVTV